MLPGSGGEVSFLIGVTGVTGVTAYDKLLYLLINIDVTPALPPQPALV